MDLFLLLPLYLLLAAICALAPSSRAAKKGHSRWEWWIFGFLFLPVAWPASFLIRPTQKVIEQEGLKKGDLKRCPECAEVVRREALKCRYCDHEFKMTGSMSASDLARR